MPYFEKKGYRTVAPGWPYREVSVEEFRKNTPTGLFPRVVVFITHGGMNSVQKALSFGIPLEVVPQMQE